MKKVIAFCLAAVLFVGVVIAHGFQVNGRLKELKGPLHYVVGRTKYSCIDAIKDSLDENTILFLGSSELGMLDEKSHPKMVFDNGNSDFNMLLYGAGYNQSLSHAITIGALADDIPNKKVVLNLSPQWFTEKHLEPTVFASRSYELMLEEFVSNEKISDETRQKVLNRCRELFSTYPTGLEKLELYERVYLEHTCNPVDRLNLSLSSSFMKLKTTYELAKSLDSVSPSKKPPVKAQEIDYQKLMETAEQQGKEDCTNNDFYIYDKYYETYIEPKFKEKKDSQKSESYCVSKEYDDLKLFLDVCRENGLQVMLVNIPVNGFWYDYVGFPKADREQYYQNIRDIAKEYDVSLLDLSTHEYTPYFLKDVMHLGWKGWVYVDQGVYEFYKQDKK